MGVMDSEWQTAGQPKQTWAVIVAAEVRSHLRDAAKHASQVLGPQHLNISVAKAWSCKTYDVASAQQAKM